jgi:hypothetical protein
MKDITIRHPILSSVILLNSDIITNENKSAMNTKFVIASVLMAAALTTGIFSTTTTAVYADESETNTEQSIKQKNVGGDASSQFNCAQNNIGGESALRADVDACGTLSVEVLDDLIGMSR